MENFFQSGERVLVLHPNTATDLEIDRVRSSLQSSGISAEFQNLSASQSATDKFDGIAIGFVGETSLPEEFEVLAQIATLLKPEKHLLLRKGERDLCRMERILRALKFAGFVSIQEQGDLVITSTPAYVPGARFHLSSSAALPAASQSNGTKKVWEELASDNVNDDLIDTDELLTEDDLKRPDPESLRVCGTTGVRKACANCVCGLAEELDAEAADERRKNKSAIPSSSCGSCYLGDAFRCAGCPYLGLPAFKPGDKVILDDTSDI